jgi:formylglycine-generating enzyme required for sulfatase activity
MTAKLKVFVCYATVDLKSAQKIYLRLKAFDWISPWISGRDLLPGDGWEYEIEKSIEQTDVALILLSQQAFKRDGDLYNIREIKKVLYKAEGRPDHEVVFIPILLDGVAPEDYLPGDIGKSLSKRHWVDLSKDHTLDNFEKLRRILELIAVTKYQITIDTILEQDLSSGDATRFNDAIKYVYKQGDHVDDMQYSFLRNTLLKIALNVETALPTRFMAAQQLDIELAEESNYGRELRDIVELDIYKLTPISNSILYMFKYPVTNIQYERFLTEANFVNPKYWTNLPLPVDERYLEGWKWLQDNKVRKVLEPRHWDDPKFGKLRRGFPVIGITLYEAIAYCNWLMENWESLTEKASNPGIRPSKIRLPTVDEWLLAAGWVGGQQPLGFPWHPGAVETDSFTGYANVKESSINETTPVWMFPHGASSNGLYDMAGNVLEWTTTLHPNTNDQFSLLGGCWKFPLQNAKLSNKFPYYPWRSNYTVGFRVVVEC